MHNKQVIWELTIFKYFFFSLQPDISRYASELLPVLFKYLECLCVELQQGNKEPVGLDRMFYALEMFCENLDDSLLPYLPNLMEPLFTLLKSKCSVHLRELVISAIGATGMQDLNKLKFKVKLLFTFACSSKCEIFKHKDV